MLPGQYERRRFIPEEKREKKEAVVQKKKKKKRRGTGEAIQSATRIRPKLIVVALSFWTAPTRRRKRKERKKKESLEKRELETD